MNYLQTVTAFIDSAQITVAIVGYCIVFAALVLLYLIFSNIPKLTTYINNRQLRKTGKKEIDSKTDSPIPADVTAAISLALHLYYGELHDEESNVLTIKKVSKRYSPWSSKIYSAYNFPQKK